MSGKNLFFTILTTLFVGAGCSREKTYGEPVFGTVEEISPVVTTSSGQVRGENRNSVAIFRGIPYGGPCEGENRWKAPSDPEPWEGVRDCTKNGPIAVQMGGSISGNAGQNPFNGGHPELFGVADEVQSENCLVLDVVTPGLDKAGRPVVVYIHGGGFATGSGSLVLGADEWAREEDIVIVGVNHRLNVFGYLYLGGLDPEYASSGMAGMLDLVKSLEWVRDNITAFGGDPSKVTIMGESGGGMKVSTLMSMPAAKGLFRHAIVESGSSPVGTLSRDAAAAQTLRLLDAMGISPDNWKSLLERPSDEILRASASLNLSPVADDINLPYTEGGTYASAISKDIPLLVGSSADEMGAFTRVNESLTWADLPEGLEAVNFRGDEPWHMQIRYQSISGFLGCGAWYQAMAKAEQGGAPVYNYFIEYDTPMLMEPSYKCAWHTADLPLEMRIVLYPELETWSRTLAHAWAAFIRTGSPSTEMLEWPEFTTAEKKVMLFDNGDDFHVETDPMGPSREAFSKIQ